MGMAFQSQDGGHSTASHPPKKKLPLGYPDLILRLLDMQSNAVPLSYNLGESTDSVPHDVKLCSPDAHIREFAGSLHLACIG